MPKKPSRRRKKSEAELSAFRLVKDLKERRINPKDVSIEQRRAALTVIGFGSLTTEEIAAFFGVSVATIRSDLKTIRKEFSDSAPSPNEALAQLHIYAERLTAKALKDDNYQLAWGIQKDLLQAMKSVGAIGGGDDGTGIRITLEGLQANHERARKALIAAMNPELTGTVIDTPAKVTTVSECASALASSPVEATPSVEPSEPIPSSKDVPVEEPNDSHSIQKEDGNDKQCEVEGKADSHVNVNYEKEDGGQGKVEHVSP